MRLALAILVLATAAMAKVNMKIDLSTSVLKDKRITTKARALEINTDLETTQVIKLDDQGQEIEIKVSKNFPEEFKALDSFDEKAVEFYIESKIYEKTKKGRKLISAPKVITVPGKEAIIEKTEEKDGVEIKTRMVIKPTQI